MIKKIMQLFLGEPEGYVSEIDKFIESRHFKLSQSQQQEIAHSQHVAELRGGPS